MNDKQKVMLRATTCLRSLKDHLETMQHVFDKVKHHDGVEDEDYQQNLVMLYDEVQQVEEAFQIEPHEGLKVKLT